MEKTANHATALAAAGALFLGLAGFFLWRDLALPRELVLSLAALVTGAATVLGRPRRWPALAPLGLFATTAATATWFAFRQEAALLPPLGIAAVMAVGAAARALHEGRGDLAGRLTWYVLGAALLAASWAVYFHFFTAGFAAELVARRLVLTLVWLGLGLGFVIGGRRRIAAIRQVGLAFIGCAAAKAAAYDTTHLAGTLRIEALAAVGALLVLGGWVIGRLADAPATEEF